ncbi:MAG: TolC family protein [Pirellulales bacterium]
MQPVLAGVAAGIMLLVLPGCCIPKLSGPEPGQALPGTFNGAVSSENSSQVSINDFFHDPVLTQLIAQGLAQNQELKIRNQEIEIANNEIRARRGAYLPFITGGGGGGFDRHSLFTPLGAAEDQLTYPGGGRFPDPVPNVGLGLNLDWELDIWRRLRNARDAAVQRYYEAIDARDYLITRLVAEIAENYYELAALDKRLVFLEQTIALQERSLLVAKFQKRAARGTELGVQRFLGEVRKNESQRLILRQRIIEVENRINFLAGRYPQPVDRMRWDYIRLDSRLLSVGVPAQLLRNRRDIRAADREVAASGLDVQVARANFFPRVSITAGVGFEAFNPRYLFDPGALCANATGNLVAPLINKAAIRAEYLSANARQLQAVYNYQRTVLNAFTEVVNQMAKVENYRGSVTIKGQQVRALEESVSVATDLFNLANPEVEYMDVLFSQRDLLEARTVLIETKQQQLSAIVNAYQALGGGWLLGPPEPGFPAVLPGPGQPDAEQKDPPPMPPQRPDPVDGVEDLPAPGDDNPPADDNATSRVPPLDAVSLLPAR